MNIWIVSSDQFINDFKKIATFWAKKNNKIRITTISRYWLDPFSFCVFYFEFLKFKPDIILTDHGYPGFALINLHKKIFKKPHTTALFLRGNYWLEERTRREKSN